MIKQAVILAGGKGTRLRPYTVSLPKPLMPIGEHPILEVVVRQLLTCGFNKIVMAVNHQADIIKAFFQNGEKWGIDISYSLEDKPLSTMGPLKLISDLPEDFLVMNGDLLTNLNYDTFLDAHISEGRLFSISASQRVEKVDYGVLRTDGMGYLTAFEEKPVHSYLVSMGVYALNRSVLDYIPEDTPFGFDDLMHKLLDVKQKVSVVPHNGYWLDIGRPDDYARAIDDYENMDFLL